MTHGLKTWVYWYIMFLFFMSAGFGLLISGNYKNYGKKFIKDD
jgi:hypothetical protein